MVEIIPAILVKTFEEFKKKVDAVENYTKWVQLDVSDGDFAPSRAWGDPVALHDYDPGVFIEAHLMVSEPERVIDDWLTGRSEEKDSGVSRIYFHYEATSQHEALITKIKDAGKEVGIALLPETPLGNIKLFDELLDAVLLFSGSLGFYGGTFNEEATLPKITALRQAHPQLIIEVDGGMNPETARRAVDAGASAIVSGGFIWNNGDIEAAIEELQNAVA